MAKHPYSITKDGVTVEFVTVIKGYVRPLVSKKPQVKHIQLTEEQRIMYNDNLS